MIFKIGHPDKGTIGLVEADSEVGIFLTASRMWDMPEIVTDRGFTCEETNKTELQDDILLKEAELDAMKADYSKFL